MDSYNVSISPKALSQLNSYINYINDTLLNEQAAYNVWLDALETRERLSNIAGSLAYCQHPQLKALGYRSINFIHHKYIMLYRVSGTNVFVDAVYHQLQDYEYRCNNCQNRNNDHTGKANHTIKCTYDKNFVPPGAFFFLKQTSKICF